MAWLAAFAVAALLEYAPHASLWFPPAAITFSAVLVLGLRCLPVLWLACLIVTVLSDWIHGTGLGWPALVIAGLAFGLTHTLAFGAVALFLRRGAIHASPVTTLRKVSLFLLGGAAAAGLSAVFGGLSLALNGMIELAAVPPLIAPWWIGDYAGLVTVAPLFGLLLTRSAELLGVATPQGLRRLMGSQPWRALFPVAAGKLGLMLGLTLIVLMAAALFPQKESVLFLMFVALIVQLWIVHSESELAALLGILLFSTLLAIAAGQLGLSGQALMLQFVVISLAVSSYLGLAVPALYRDNVRLRELLTHDILTGALTRSFFEDAAREGIRRAVQESIPACLVMIDLDGLKRINDSHGHAVGDIALKTVARACAQNLAPGQLLGRLSGDEFAMFLIDCDLDSARQVIEAVRLDLVDSPPVINALNAEASFGVAELDPACSDFNALLAEADRAMYREKRA
jgi:diguanylate cyclase (GGDEF)-like protein